MNKLRKRSFLFYNRFMNQTKKITQGAMMLAITGALIVIDRMMAYAFSTLIILAMPVIVIMYSSMHTFKDGLMISAGLLIIAFLLGNLDLLYMIFVPVSLFTGILYAWGIKRGWNKRRLLINAVISYIIGEVLASFVIYPLLGFPVSQYLAEMKAMFDQSGSMAGIDYEQMFSLAGMELDRLLPVLYIFTVFLTGAMEGLLIHLLAVFMLKKFKIMDLGRIDLIVRPNPLLAYLAIAMVSSGFFMRFVDNESTLYYIMIVIMLLGSMILMYYGYVFIILYGRKVLHRNIGGLFIIICMFVPFLLLVLVMIGFLYASGPLNNFLESLTTVKK